MEDLEEIFDLIAGCKVDFNRDDLYTYLANDIGRIQDIDDTDEGIDKFEAVYRSLRNIAIDVYSAALKNYYTFDEEQYIKVNKEKGLIQVLRKPR